MKILTLDIGGTYIRSAICNESGILTDKAKFNTPQSPDEVIKLFLKIYEKYNDIDSFGVSVGGAVLDEGYVWLPNAFGGDPYPLKGKLEDRTGLEINILDDRVSGLIGETWKGAAVNSKNSAYYIIGTGVGLGIQVHGHVIKGAHGAAGSIGWIPIGEENDFSNKVGVLESNISGYYMSKNYERMCKKSVKGAFDIFNDYEKGGECSQQFISNVSILLGKSLATIINILDPEIIIMAGSVGQRWNIFKFQVEEIMERYLSPIIKNIEIVPSVLGEDAQLIGIGKYALNYMNRR
ncbi:ROK family protein [Petrotoga sp. 9PWA.NaAc.5.4]|uniref:ROK family protein n=1 Tax=Petrotoga sp. 9PWA.NaAc.5.4 TaxID=1434328 RepID=UPI000CA8A168|nr:ROK family protein [Petrotoga sp. 9PWA.NaAc.5.4]PNR95385.1 hypothetical protein X924_04670 [Petrotoga sp. 9PWA.NaAc.5.4]